MAGLMRREPHREAGDVFSRLDPMFDEWVRMMPFRPVLFAHCGVARHSVAIRPILGAAQLGTTNRSCHSSL